MKVAKQRAEVAALNTASMKCFKLIDKPSKKSLCYYTSYRSQQVNRYATGRSENQESNFNCTGRS